LAAVILKEPACAISQLTSLEGIGKPLCILKTTKKVLSPSVIS
jgi:hypothetical protein